MRSFVIAAAATAAFTLPLWAQSETPSDEDDGGGFLERMIEDRLSGDGVEVRIRGFEGALSSRATLDSLTVSDADGTWFTLRDAVLDWNRSALLRGRLEVQELSAGEILLPRLPQGGGTEAPSPEAQPFALPDLPVSIQIDKLAIGRAVIGQPIIGEEAAVSLAGSASLSGGEGRASLEIDRVDGEAGRFAFTGAYDNGSERLELDLDLSEGPDGLIANLIDLPGRPALTASVAGAGPLSDFTAQIELTTDGEPRLAGTVTLKGDGEAEARRFAADIGGDIAPVFLPSYRPFFGPEIRLQAEGAQFPSGRLVLDQFALQARSLDLSGALAIGADGAPERIALKGEIAGDAGPVLLPLGEATRVGRVGLDVDFDASRGEEWTGQVVIAGLEREGLLIEETRLDGQGIIAQGADGMTVTAGFDFATQGMRLADGGLQRALGDSATGRAEIDWATGRPVVLETLRFEGATYALSGSGRVDPSAEGLPAALEAQIRAETLEPFSALAGRPLAGALEGRVDLDARLLARAFDIRLDALADDLSLDIPQLDPLLEGRTELTLAADRDETGTRLETLRLVNPGLQLTAQANLSSAASDARLNLAVSDLSRIDEGLSGPLNLAAIGSQAGPDWNVTIEGSGAGARIDGRGTLTGMEGEQARAEGRLTLAAEDLSNFAGLAGRPLAGAVELTAEGSAGLDLRNAELSLEGGLTGVEIGQPDIDRLLRGQTDLALQAARDGDALRLSRLDIANPQISVEGSADWAGAPALGSGAELSIRLPDLAEVVPELDGPATLRLTAREDGAEWDVVLDGQGAGAEIAADLVLTDLFREVRGISGEASVALADLAPFSRLAGRELGGSLSLDLSGRARSDLSVVEAEAAGQAQDLALGVVELDRLLDGRTDLDLALDKQGSTVTLPRLSLENPQLSLTGSGSYAGTPGDTGRAELALRLAELSRIVPQLSGPAELTASATESEGIWSVDLNGDGAGIDLSADVDIEGLMTEAARAVSGQARLAAADLAPFSDLAGRDLGGSLELAAEGRARFDLAELDVALDGQLTDLALGQPDLNRLLEGVTEIDGQVIRDGDAFALPRLRVENPQIALNAQGRADAEAGNSVTARLRLPEIGAVVPELSGPLSLEIAAQEQGRGWDVQASGDGAGLNLGADLALTGLSGAGPITAEGRATLGAADLAPFSRIAGRDLGGSLRLVIDGVAAADGSRLEGVIDGLAQDLKTGIPEADRLLAGTTELDAEARMQEGAVIVEALRLANPQLRLLGQARYGNDAGAAQLDLALSDLLDLRAGLSGGAEAALFAEQVARDAWSLSLEASGAGAELDVLGEIGGIGGAAAPVFDGRVTARAALARLAPLTGQRLAGTVNAQVTGRAALDGARFDLVADASANGLRTGISQADALLGGRLELDAAMSRQGAEAPIRVSRLSVEGGQVLLAANGQVLGGASDLRLDARIANIAPLVDGLSGPLAVQGTVRERAGRLALDLDAEGPAGTIAAITGSVTQDFASADLGINGRLPLGLVNGFIAPRSLDGTATFDLALNGRPGLDALSGRVAVADARAVLPNLETVLEDLDLEARLGGGRVELRATAAKQAGGRLTVAGPISLSPGYRAELAVQLAGLVVEDPSLYRTSVDGTVTLNGPLTGGAVIGGRLVLDETELRIPSTGLGATGPIPEGLVHVNEPPEVRATRRRAGLIEEAGGGDGGGGVAFPLDLVIEAPRQIFVRGRGLDAELGGQLRLSGTTANVIPAGQFDLIRGRIDILGKRLVLDEGLVSLQGDFVPQIRLVARTDAGEVVVLIVVEGPALSPEIDFLSQPELPEDEVLARLLFGRSIDNISPLQAAQLASAVATLAGRGGDGIVANLRQEFGLDDLDVTTDEDGTVGLRAGKYLSENLYTDVTVGAEGDAEINLNLDITPSLSARGSASSSGETSLGIFYEKDY